MNSITFDWPPSSQLLSSNSPPTKGVLAATGTDNGLPDPAGGAVSPAMAGDLGAELAALAIIAGQRQRESATKTRDGFQAAQTRAEEAEVAAMRQKADDIQTEALASGLSTIAEGVSEARGGVCSYNESLAKIHNDQLGSADWALEGRNEKSSALFSKATGTLLAGLSRAAQEGDDATATERRSEAEHAKTAAEDMHDIVREADRTIHAAIDFYREYLSTKNQSLLAAVHRS